MLLQYVWAVLVRIVNERHKARLTGANPAELMNTITTDANHVASLPN
jgi:hypothetical protein